MKNLKIPAAVLILFILILSVSACAKAYLVKAGMQEEQIAAFLERIS